MQVVAVADCPASTPDRVAPNAAVTGGDVGGGPLGLAAQPKVRAHVVLHSAAEHESKARNAGDATMVGRKVRASESKHHKGSGLVLPVGEMEQEVAHVLIC